MTETGDRRGNNFRERAERRNQRLGQRFDIAPGLGAEQHRFQEFVIRERIGASLAKALAQALPMAVIMRRALGQPALALALFQH